MVGNIRGIHHVALTVPDLSRAIEFYSGLLGFEEVVRQSLPPSRTASHDTSDPVVSEQVRKVTEQLKRVHALDDDVEPELTIVMLKTGNICLELWSYDNPKTIPQNPEAVTYQCGIMHFALDVVDLDELYPRLVAGGVKFHAPPQRSSQVNTTYGRDPFGNIIEFQEILPEATHIPRLTG